MAGVATAVLFTLSTNLIFDARENRIRSGEADALRQRVSEQNLELYRLNARFQALETDVERMRAMDARVRSLARFADPKASPATALGGMETPASEGASGRLDKLLDLRFDRLKKDVLVSVKDLEILGDRLNARRLHFESVPSLRPVRGILSSPFGVRTSPFTETDVFHHGVDVPGDMGTPVMSSAAGKVVRAGFESLIGNVVAIDHGNGFVTLYGHLSEIRVATGEVVDRGQVIGAVGNTGRSTGPHLHYEVRANGLPVNPVRYMN